MERFSVVSSSEVTVKKFNLKGTRVTFKINQQNLFEDPSEHFKKAIKDIVENLVSDVEPRDKIGFTFSGKEYESPGYLKFQACENLKWEDIFSMISLIFQSNSEGLSTDQFTITATVVKIPQGQGISKKRSNFFNSYTEECFKRQGIIVIKNNDNLCLPRALVVAKAYVDKDPNFSKIRNNIKKEQLSKAEALIIDAQVVVPPHGCRIEEIQQFQLFLKDYQIVVYEYSVNHRKDVIFKGEADCEKRLNLLHHNDHFNVIKSLTAAFCCVYFCNNCDTPYNNKDRHMCIKQCYLCQNRTPCKDTQFRLFCDDCNRNFRGQQCLIAHKQNKICEKIKRCNLCLKIVKQNKNKMHICNEYLCKVCKEIVPPNHLCFMQKDEKHPDLENTLYVFYDLETQQDKIVGEKILKGVNIGNVFEHEPNLCVFQVRCTLCLNESNLSFCNKCKFRQVIYKTNVIENFVKYLLNVRQKFKNVIVIAHNSQGFDCQFLLNYFIKKTSHTPKLIMRGTKIILMILANIKFIDSLNFFPMSLSKLPDAFNLTVNLKKGYFPHYFNTKDNENYEGPLPAIHYYKPDCMSTKDREAFLKWYAENKNHNFNLKYEIEAYCVNDVEILTQACLKFRNMMLSECNVEPFLECVTVAGTCSLVFRRNFLAQKTIGIIPSFGYRCVDTQSKSATHWMLYLEKKHNIEIIFAGRGREVKIGGLKVDGFCEATQEVFEFHGCFFHGCPSCFKRNRDTPLNIDSSDTLNLRYERTQLKINRIKSFNFRVHEMYSCEFSKLLKFDAQLKALEDHSMLKQSPLLPRDSFFGGRTGGTVSYYKCKEGERILYFDICSLYPYICKTGTFPLGHPKNIFIGDDQCKTINLNKTEGLIKCKILPPVNLYHPVLPMKQNNKLMFSLCFTCSNSMIQDRECTHSDEERALTGTWVICEVRKALEKNYIMLEIFEIWSYDTLQYDPEKKINGMFTEIMNKFIKTKTEASGWPSSCNTDEEKQKYVSEFLKYENVQLDFNKIEKNPGLRSVAKLLLNSFWGKFGQAENMRQTEITQNPTELFSLLTKPSVDVCQILPIDEKNIVIQWENNEEANEPLSTVNVVIAAFTTAQARLKLYSYLEKLGSSVLYFDTDSILFVDQIGSSSCPPTGEFVGDMTDELECYGSGSFITEFVCGGPKNYAYKVFSTKNNEFHTVCKVKGIRLNYETSQIVNFDNIKKIILDDSDSKLSIKSTSIQRTVDHSVITVPTVKEYKPVLLKRRFLNDHTSVPYGYKQPRTCT